MKAGGERLPLLGWVGGRSRVLGNHQASLSHELVEVMNDLEDRIGPGKPQGILRHGLELLRPRPEPLGDDAGDLLG